MLQEVLKSTKTCIFVSVNPNSNKAKLLFAVQFTHHFVYRGRMRSSSEVSRPIIFSVNSLSISIVIWDKHSAAKSLFFVDDASFHIWHEFSFVSLLYMTEFSFF